MADSSIEWTDKTWNPSLGCERVSPGCGGADVGGCYAERLAFRLAAMGKREYDGLTHRLPDGKVRWTGKVICLPERLPQPLAWKKPARIFVDSMSDLFHEDVPDDFIAQVFGVMAICDWHVFQVLTKRPERMRSVLNNLAEKFRMEEPFLQAVSLPPDWVRSRTEIGWTYGRIEPLKWPLPNVWLGTSVEDQQRADERIPLLLQTPAAVRFLSCEPLLGPVNLQKPWPATAPLPGSGGVYAPWMIQQLDWVIAGGESGPNFRPMDLDWIRSLRDQCQAAGVAFFAKQNSGPRTHMWLPDDLQSHEFPTVREAVLA